MSDPRIAFATAADGVRIGWTSVGTGPTLMHLPGVGGGVHWRGHEYDIARPELVDLNHPEVSDALAGPIRFMSRRLGIADWVRVSRAT